MVFFIFFKTNRLSSTFSLNSIDRSTVKANIDNRHIVLTLSLAASACLVAAFYYPFMYSDFNLEFPAWMPGFLAAKTQAWIIQKGNIPTGPHHLLEIVLNLFLAHEFFVGIAIALFSIGFPIIKIGLVFFLSLFGHRLEATHRHRLIAILNSVSKWSMADVFIVGMFIVFMKAEGFHFRFAAGAGLYFFAAAAILSAVAFQILSHNEILSVR